MLRELAALPEVAGLPNREQIIHDNPDITKREAEQLRRERKKGTASSSAQQQAQSLGQQQGGFLKDKRGYLKDVCNLAEKLRKKAEEGLDATNEQLDDMAQVAGELTLLNFRAACKTGVALADLLLERRRQLEAEGQTAPEDADASQATATEHAHPEASVQVEA